MGLGLRVARHRAQGGQTLRFEVDRLRGYNGWVSRPGGPNGV